MTAILLFFIVSVAQAARQRYYLESVGFEYLSQGNSAKRCVQWRNLVKSKPVVQFENGKPFVELQLEARIEGRCPLKFADGKELNVSGGEGALKRFRFKVFAPSSVYVISGPGFSDQLIFEALISQPKEVGFFKFFENSETRFDLGFGQFKTNNALVSESLRTAKAFPIMSGLIAVPLPRWSRVHLGFSLSQNLSNLTSDPEVQFQFSEFSFDTRFFFPRIFGAGSRLGLVGEIRGRNWYQLGTQKPFVVRSSPGLGFGIEYDHWFAKKVGLTLSSRYGIRSTADADSKGEWRASGALHFKVSPKWALGGGYRWARLGVDFPDSTTNLGKISEQSNIYFLSLMLLNSSTGVSQ